MERLRNNRPGPLSLADLRRQRLRLFVYCNRCSHNVSVSPGPLIKRLGAGCPVPEVGKKMRCSKCGWKSIHTKPDWPHVPMGLGLS